MPITAEGRARVLRPRAPCQVSSVSHRLLEWDSVEHGWVSAGQPRPRCSLLGTKSPTSPLDQHVGRHEAFLSLGFVHVESACGPRR